MHDLAEARWGTWEELVLGGAVLRHGARDWDAVAAELRRRTICPYVIFTAEMCKAKYEDLQKRYLGCKVWFEELKKRRVAELKRELEKSEDSIGSLESKLESLKAERSSSTIAENTESPASVGNRDGFEISGKDSSKDGLSAGSFTDETRTNWSPESQNPAATTTTTVQDIKPIIGSNVKKRRGKRKRKGCEEIEIKEGSVGDNEIRASIDRHNHLLVQDSDKIEDLTRVLDSIEQNENGSAFRRRLDHQRRARYKRTIRRHVDMDTIRSRISRRTIASLRELHRDLLLLCNNALVFYPKDSREFRSAELLRELVNRTFLKIPEPSRIISMPRSARREEVGAEAVAPKSENARGGGGVETGTKGRKRIHARKMDK